MITVDSDVRAELSNGFEESQAQPVCSQPNTPIAVGIDTWSLYNYAYNSLESSFLIYSLADLRKYARGGLFDDESCRAILTVPIRIEAAIELLWKHRDVLQKKWGEFDTQLFVDSMDSVEKRMEVAAWATGHKGYLAEELGEKAGGIQYFHDDNDKEPTYVIVANVLAKTLAVVFRGTKTLNDVQVDAKMAMKSINNPLADVEGLSEKFRLHRGFSGFLYKKASQEAKGKSRKWDGTTGSTRGGTKCQEILSDTLEILQQFPDYHLCVTGHSMGGALATLFAFELSALRHRDEELIRHPIACVAVASPMLGDNHFRRTFQFLEREGHLQCLRVENDFDIVPLYPWTSLSFLGVPFSPFFPSVRYRHVGVQLKIHATKQTFELSYPRYRRGLILFALDFWSTIKRLCWLALCCLFVSAREGVNHHCGEYRKRLMDNAETLGQLTLANVYERIRKGEAGLLETSGKLRLKAVEPRI